MFWVYTRRRDTTSPLRGYRSQAEAEWRRGMGATLVCGWQHSSCYNSGDCTDNRRGDFSKAAPPQELSAPTLADRARRPGRRACKREVHLSL